MVVGRGWCLALGLWLALTVTAAPARVVGLALDDSAGTRAEQQGLLAAVQLWLALAEREDRLWLTGLAGGLGLTEVPATRAEFGAELGARWAAAWGGRLDHAPLKQLLAALIAAADAETPVSLLVVSAAAPAGLPSELAARLAALRERPNGPPVQLIHVRLAAPSATVAADALPADPLAVALREAFGAAATTFVASPDQMLPTLAAAVVAALGGDDAAGSAVCRDDEELSFLLPFPVQGLRLLTVDPPGTDPPELTQASFRLRKAPPYALAADLPLAGTGAAVRVQHLELNAPLAAGVRHCLRLSRPPGANDRLLFNADLRLRVAVADAQDQPLARDADDYLLLPPGQAAALRAWVETRHAGRWELVAPDSAAEPTSDLAPEPVAALAPDPDSDPDSNRDPRAASTGTAVPGTADAQAGTQAGNQTARSALPIRMSLVTGDAQQPLRAGADGVQVATLGPFQSPGTHRLAVSAQVPGVLTLPASELTLRVTAPRAVTPALQGRHLRPCPDCAPEQVELVYGPRDEEAEPYLIEAAVPDAPGPAEYGLSLVEPLPAGVAVLGADQTPLLADGAREASLRIDPQAPVQLRLRYDQGFDGAAPVALQLRLAPHSPALQGSAELTLTLVPTVAPLALVAAGHTLPDAEAPFALPITALHGRDGLYVAAEGLRAPLDPAHLRLNSPPQLPLRLTLDDDGERLLISPRPRPWFRFLVPAGAHPFQLDYHNPATRQQASYQASLDLLPVPWWQAAWRELLLGLLLLLVLLKLLCLALTNRFPTHARVLWYRELDQAGQPMPPRRFDLHRPLRAFFACNNERRRVGGLQLIARDGFVDLLPGRGLSEGLRHQARGESLTTLFERGGGEPIPWNYNEQLRDDLYHECWVLVHDRRRVQEDDLAIACRGH